MVTPMHQFVILLTLLASSTRARTRSPTCLPQFETNPRLYEPCRSSICILFKEDPPLDDLGRKPHPEAGVPFRCNDKETLFPGLKGVFFNFQRKITRLDNPYCIYASDGCKYDDLTKFLSDAADRDVGYRFMMGGLAFLVSYRITNSSTPSVPFFGGKMLIIGPRRNSADIAFKTVYSAFTLQAWIFVLSVFTVLFATRTLIMYNLGAPTTGAQLWWYILDDPQIPEKPDRVERARHERLQFWASKWRFTTKATVFIVLMVFEAGFVSYLFGKNQEGPEIQVTGLTEKQLEEYAVVQDSAEEFFFRSLVDRDGKYNVSVPWVRCNTSAEIFQKIGNRSERAKYGLTYEQFGKTQLRDAGLCDNVTIYRSKDITQKYSAVWYFGLIPEKQRQAINENIRRLVESQPITELLCLSVPEEENACGEQPFSVDWLVFLIPVAVVVIPFVFLFVISTILYHYCFTKQADPKPEALGIEELQPKEN